MRQILFDIIIHNGKIVDGTDPSAYTVTDRVIVADPETRRETVAIEGEVPSPFDLPAGSVFRTRCPHPRNLCRETPPSLARIAAGEYVAFHFPLKD